MGKGIINDPLHQLAWYLRSDERCGTFGDMQRQLPEGFAIPTLEQLQLFKAFLEASGDRDLQRKYSYLSHSQTEVWSQKEKKYTKYRATFRLVSGEIAYHDPETFCGWVVGVLQP